MLSVNHLQILKEIQSLSNEIISLTQEINSEHNRVQKLENLKDRNLSDKNQYELELNRLVQEMKSQENSLSKMGLQLDTKKSQLALISNEKQLSSIESEIQHLDAQIPLIENQTLELMEKIEVTEGELSELNLFFANIDQTIANIQKEVSESIEQKNNEVLVLKERITLLEQEFPESILTKIKRARESSLKPFISLIVNSSCQSCGMSVSSTELTQIQSLNNLYNCSGCSRLLIP